MKIKKIIKTAATIMATAAVVMGVLAASPVQNKVYAEDAGAEGEEGGAEVTDPATEGMKEGAEAAHGGNTPDNLFGGDSVFTDIVNAALSVIGAVAVIMLIYGGIRYTISGGDQANITAAKNIILYSVIGIVVAIMAYAIVNFVLTQFNTAPETEEEAVVSKIVA